MRSKAAHSKIIATATPTLVALLLFPALIAGHPALAARNLAYLPLAASRAATCDSVDSIDPTHARRAAAHEPAPLVRAASIRSAQRGFAKPLVYHAPHRAHACRAP